MKWTRLTNLEKEQRKVNRLCKWHKHFAWWPVTVESEDHKETVVWLSFVGRKGSIVDLYADYGTYWGIGSWQFCPVDKILENALICNDILVSGARAPKWLNKI